jgi:hypothetical protein
MRQVYIYRAGLIYRNGGGFYAARIKLVADLWANTAAVHE